ncbi:hypothetical protein EMPG_13959 [Blastomyces silverae]|uniref:Uncharacterized protein n=1 Tax=Blastomyces silverae TaxID=2060906 RepID=A0A0H1BH22_9EURO|nr:hypothetical protein EMPG_13959 [Blastomyces silverae]
MEAACGMQLAQVWENMDLNDRKSIIEDRIGIEKRLVSVSFSLYGSLYFIQDSFAGCKSAEITTNIAASGRDDVKRKFVAGPIALREFWEKERSQMPFDRGPSWVYKYASSTARAPGYMKPSEAQRSPREHTQLLNK